MVVYYCISNITLVHGYIDYNIYFSLHVNPLSNRRSPFNRLRDEPIAFLVTFPGTPAGSSSSHRRSWAAPRFSLLAGSPYVVLQFFLRDKKEVEEPRFEPSTLGVASFYADC